MQRTTLAWASVVLLMAFALGSFVAHGLEDNVGPRSLHNWTTATHYQFYHGLALMGLAALEGRIGPKLFRAARACFLLGIMLFCGSLYLLALRGLLGMEGMAMVLGPITPLGGLLFMLGWATLLWAALRKG